MTNQIRITLACFLAYFVMSGTLAPIGIVVSPMADYLSVSVPQAAALFSWLTMGILVGSILALVVFDWVSIRQLLIILYTLIAAALCALLVSENRLTIGLALGVVGTGCGIGLAAAASLISTLYRAERRASLLVVTDGCFSIAGIVCAWLATLLISKSLHWSGSYLFVAFIAIVIVWLSLISRFPTPPHAEPNPSHNTNERTENQHSAWPLGVWLCIASLFLYTTGQNALLWWLPTYYQTHFQISPEQANPVVGQFWTGMFLAQMVVTFAVFKLGVTRLLFAGAGATLLASIPLWARNTFDGMTHLALLWGFANLGLLKILLSYATQLITHPSPRLVSALLLGATSGTAVSPWMTSQLVAQFGERPVLQLGSGCYLALLLLLIVTHATGGKHQGRDNNGT